MASLDVSDEKFKTEREVVKEERRMRFENQPYGRLSGDHLRQGVHDASVQAPDDRQHGGSRGRVDRGRARVPRHVLRAEQRDGRARRRLRHEAGAGARRAVPRAACRRASRCRATFRRSRRTRRRSATRSREPWPLPAVVVSYHITYDGHPDSYPLHILAKILSDGDSSRIYRSLVYEKQLALAAFGEAKLIEHPNLFYAVAIVAARAQARGRAEGAARRDRSREDRRRDRGRAQSRQAAVRARLHLRPRDRAAEGAAAGARDRDSQRHQDGRRRVRSVPERDAGRRAARGADVLHARSRGCC